MIRAVLEDRRAHAGPEEPRRCVLRDDGERRARRTSKDRRPAPAPDWEPRHHRRHQKSTCRPASLRSLSAACSSVQVIQATRAATRRRRAPPRSIAPGAGRGRAAARSTAAARRGVSAASSPSGPIPFRQQAGAKRLLRFAARGEGNQHRARSRPASPARCCTRPGSPIPRNFAGAA